MNNFDHPLHKEYIQFCGIQSDINEHMPVLYQLALRCKTITEFGVGYGRSTRAFIASLLATEGELNSYEIKILDGVKELFARAEKANLQAYFHLQNVLGGVEIKPTDLLLVDSHHTYTQVFSELQMHGNKVNKYIAFHDTITFGEVGQDNGSLGIRPAIDDWMEKNKEWIIKEELLNNNGLLILEKV